MMMRSWSAFVMPITLTGLHALSVLDADHASRRGRRGSRDRAHDVRRARCTLVRDRLRREVLAGRHLLQRRGVEDDVGVAAAPLTTLA